MSPGVHKYLQNYFFVGIWNDQVLSLQEKFEKTIQLTSEFLYSDLIDSVQKNVLCLCHTKHAKVKHSNRTSTNVYIYV